MNDYAEVYEYIKDKKFNFFVLEVNGNKIGKLLFPIFSFVDNVFKVSSRRTLISLNEWGKSGAKSDYKQKIDLIIPSDDSEIVVEKMNYCFRNRFIMDRGVVGHLKRSDIVVYEDFELSIGND